MNGSRPIAPQPAALNPDGACVALRTINQLSLMVAYWDVDQKCVFSSDACRRWFQKSSEEMTGRSLQELLGPLYEKNLPYIQGVLTGRPQVSEQLIFARPDGTETKNSIVTYTPDVVDGVVVGFSLHVTDVSSERRRDATVVQTLNEAILALEKTKGSFRSRQLGDLRQRFEQVLAEFGPA